MSDPVAIQARMVAAAFRQKGLRDVAEMIDYLADRADERWELDADSARMLVALRAAWVGLVPSMRHSLRECNGGPDGGGPWCFTCDAMAAIQPFQHLWATDPADAMRATR